MSIKFKQPLINLRKLFNDFYCHTHPDKFIGKNYIINPTFIINQREFAGGNLNVDVYGFDRWKAFNASATMDVVDGVATIVGDIGQVIEDFGYVGPMTLSWKGTATAQGSGETSPLTFNKIAGITAVEFSDGTLSEVKLEIGSVATPFEYPDVGSELAKCQRYYCDSSGGNIIWSGDITTGNYYLTTAYYPVAMRTNPITVTIKPVNDSGFDGVVELDPSRSSPQHFVVSSLTDTTRARGYFSFTYTADAEL